MLNNHALNVAQINGQPEVYGEGTANISLAGSGWLSLGLMLEGESVVQVSTEATLNAFMFGEGVLAPIEIVTDLPPMVRVPLEGSLSISMSADVSPYLIMQPLMPAEVEVASEAEGTVVPPAGGTVTIRFASELVPHIVPATMGEGFAPVVVSLKGSLSTNRVIQAAADTSLFMSAWGAGNLTMLSPPGAGEIRIDAAGDTRKGARLQGAGRATVTSFASGKSAKWRRIHGEGEVMVVRLQAVHATAGTPVIPEEYRPAPRGRTFYVAPDRRDFQVPRMRRIA